jgi:uncharacterized protein (DUF169 family)
MKNLKLLESKMGGRWTGVRIHRGAPLACRPAKRPMRLCEAIAESFDGPFALTPEFVDCPGARRSLGLTDDDEELAQTISTNTGVRLGAAPSAIRATPPLKTGVTAIRVGPQDSPDVVVSYAPPEVAMSLIRVWQGVRERSLDVELSTFMAICGNLVLAACRTPHIYISLGCPISRKHGIVPSHTLIIGIPYCIIDELFRVHDDDVHL